MNQSRSYKQYEADIEKVLREHPNLKANTAIARKMIENGVDASENHLRLCVAAYFSDINSIEVEADGGPAYDVIDEKYVIKAKHGVINIPVDTIDVMFFEYSEHGKNLTGTQIINKYNLLPWEFAAIKNRLQLYKKSHIFSPYTVENTPKEDMEAMVEAKMKSLTDNMGELVEKKYSTHMLKEAKRVLENNERFNLFDKFFLLTERDEDQVAPPIRVCTNVEGLDRDHIVIVIADPHFGAKTIGSKIIHDYDRQQAIDWLFKVRDIVNSRKAKKVSILLGGDYIESFTGTNHANSFQGMEYGIYGAKAYFNAVDILTTFIGSINNVCEVIGVSGNHDRADGRRDVDPKGEIGLIILEQLRRNFQTSIPVEYDSLLVYKEIDGIGYGLTHGHNSISKKKGEDLTFDYGNNRIYNVWIQAHLHEFKILQNTVKVLKVVSPSIFPGNYYSESLGFNSNPGFLEFFNNKSGKASFNLHAL